MNKQNTPNTISYYKGTKISSKNGLLCIKKYSPNKLFTQNSGDRWTNKLEALTAHNAEDELIRKIISCIVADGGKAELINNNRSCGHIANQTLHKHGKEPRSIEEIVSHEMVGKAKIIALINGNKVKIEVDPSGTNRTAKDLLMQNLIEYSGDIYYVARDFSSFIDWYHEKFKIKNRRKIPYDTNISIRVCNRKLGQVINPILKRKGGKVL